MGAIHSASISEFLTRWETRQLRGYVPCRPRKYTGKHDMDGYDPIGQSGVTIATGLDLGQQNRTSLIMYGITGDLQDKLAYYLGKTRYRAIEALHDAPLCINDAECDVIDAGVQAAFTRMAARAFDTAAGPDATHFENIPAEAQTVIVSLFYQLGGTWNRYFPTSLWAALTSCRWTDAAAILRADTSPYQARRHSEARILGHINKKQ